jgi:membrane peptidoglycan carboxypeptidase
MTQQASDGFTALWSQLEYTQAPEEDLDGGAARAIVDRAQSAPPVFALIALSVVAGLLVTLGVVPVIRIAGASVNQSAGIFQQLPEYIHVGRLPQRNGIFANGPHGPVQIATVYDQNRQEDAWNDISPYLKSAAVDGEDKNFYSHGAVDVASFVRAALTNLSSGSVQSGGSTIAMQVVRNVQIQRALELKSPAQQQAAYKAATAETVSRKLKEIKLAIGLEKTYTKRQVLLAYLNIANFGLNNYGVEAAAEAYFSTQAKSVTPAQAASIIAIVQNPSERNLGSAGNYAANESRRNFILGKMRAAGDITASQYRVALNTPVNAAYVHPSAVQNGCLPAKVAYRWICDYVVNDVDNIPALGATKAKREANWIMGGYDIYTTFNLKMQTEATNTLHSLVLNNESQFKLGGTVTTVQPGTGRILIMAENKDFNNTLKGGGPRTLAVNLNVDEASGGSAGFQPGSAYKLFTLIDWLQKGHRLTDVFNASVRSIPMSSFSDSCVGVPSGPAYSFQNDQNEQGPTTIMQATARSINSVFIQMASKLDLCDIRKVAESFGVHNATGKPLSDLPPCVIGGCDNTIAPLTLAAAYAAVADGGMYCAPIEVEKVVAPDGTQLGGQPTNCRRAVSAKVANTAAVALQGVMNGGTASAANPYDGTPFLGKTGTTNNSLQTWTVGSSTKAATAVWVGNISGRQPLRAIYVGGYLAALLRHVVFRTVMTYVDQQLGRGSAFGPPDQGLIAGGTWMGGNGTYSTGGTGKTNPGSPPAKPKPKPTKPPANPPPGPTGPPPTPGG